MATAVFSTTDLRGDSRLQADDRHGWGFALLLVTTATLFIRPADLIPAFADWPIYQFLIVTCLLVSARATARQLTHDRIITRPATACLLLLLLSVGLSHLSHGFVWAARMSMYEVAKVLALYLLITGLINTPRRLNLFVQWFTIFVTTIASLALLDRLGIISIPALESIRDRGVAEAGQAAIIERIRGTGIFQDPNDFGLILVIGLVFTAWLLFSPRAGWTRYAWLAPGGVLLTTLTLTHSRGAFFALACAIPAALAYARSWRWGLISLLGIPLLSFVFSARTTDLNAMIEGTGQTRIQIWSESLTIWKQYPLFGLGEGMLVEELGVVAHNSFLHCFAELGVFGGTAFVSCFTAAAVGLWSLRRESLGAKPDMKQTRERRDLAHLRVFMFSALVAYVAGIFSISRQFVMPTYLVLGLATATHSLTQNRLSAWQLNNRFLVAAVIASAAMLLTIYLAVRIFVRW